MRCSNLRDRAAAVGLLGLLVKHFGLRTEIITPLDEAVQLDTTLQYRIDSLVKNLSRLIQILLNLGHLISRGRVLIFLQILLDFGESYRLRGGNRSPRIANSLLEFIQQLSKKDKRNTRGIFQISRYGTGKPVRPDVAVHHIRLVLNGLALARLCPLCKCFGKECKHLFDSLQNLDVGK